MPLNIKPNENLKMFDLGRQAFVSPATEFAVRRPAPRGGQLGPVGLRAETGVQEAVSVVDKPRKRKRKGNERSLRPT